VGVDRVGRVLRPGLKSTRLPLRTNQDRVDFSTRQNKRRKAFQEEECRVRSTKAQKEGGKEKNENK